MRRTVERALDRWFQAQIIDGTTRDKILEFEVGKESARRIRWSVILICCFGGLMLAAGALLFVAAHWDRMSPTGHFSLVLISVAAFHLVAAILSDRSRLISRVLHAVGTVVMGGGIFLAAQIFHLQEHWPGAFLLWGIGAWLAWLLLRDWVQLSLAAVLTPIWLAGEWGVKFQQMESTLVFQFLALIAIAYFTALSFDRKTPLRCALTWMGGLALIPMVIGLAVTTAFPSRTPIAGPSVPAPWMVVGWGVGFGGPILLAYWLHRRQAIPFLGAVGFIALLPLFQSGVAPYLLCSAFSAYLIWWGFQDGRRERINMGIGGFALTLLFFYFSSVFDKLGRSLSLMGLGALLLVLGWVLMRLRGVLFERFEGRLS
jgi:uncharacterized membrane protein